MSRLVVSFLVCNRQSRHVSNRIESNRTERQYKYKYKYNYKYEYEYEYNYKYSALKRKRTERTAATRRRGPQSNNDPCNSNAADK